MKYAHMTHKELVDQVSANLFNQSGKIESQRSWLAMRNYLEQLDTEQLKFMLKESNWYKQKLNSSPFRSTFNILNLGGNIRGTISILTTQFIYSNARSYLLSSQWYKELNGFNINFKNYFFIDRTEI